MNEQQMPMDEAWDELTLALGRSLVGLLRQLLIAKRMTLAEAEAWAASVTPDVPSQRVRRAVRTMAALVVAELRREFPDP